MAAKLSALLKSKYIIIALATLVVVSIASVVVISTLIGNRYAERINIPEQSIKTSNLEDQKFSIKKLTLIKDGQTIEINQNGDIIKYDGSNKQILLNRRTYSASQIQQIFGNLTLDEFLALLGNYYSEDDYTLIIETTHGTKEVIFNEEGTDPPPEELEDIIDEVEDVEEDLEDPIPSPPPPPPPSPTPNPTPTPSGGPSPTPTPTPPPGTGGPPPEPTEPFSCNMLQNQINDVTVSNTVCLPDQE